VNTTVLFTVSGCACNVSVGGEPTTTLVAAAMSLRCGVAGNQTSSARRQRGTLRPEDIVTAAIKLIEERGLDLLTMGSVAEAVGAPGTSVHWHFRTREDLLLAVAKRVTEDLYQSLPPAVLDSPWEDEFATYFTAFRRNLRDHPAFLELFTTRGRTLLADPEIDALVTERLEAELATLVRARVSPEDAYRIYNTFSTYVRGFVTVELGWTRQSVPPEASRKKIARRRALDPRAYPVITSIADLAHLYGEDADANFQCGLQLLIDGTRTALRSMHAKSIPGKSRTARS
jgi:AcrR family transcriptional regulator